MTNLIEQVRALGEAIVASQEYRELQLAEAELAQDPAYASFKARMDTLGELRLQALHAGEEEDAEMYAAQEETMRAQMTELPSVDRISAARAAFSQLMTQVNNVLQFTITGELAESSCTGSCQTCGGCR